MVLKIVSDWLQSTYQTILGIEPEVNPLFPRPHEPRQWGCKTHTISLDAIVWPCCDVLLFWLNTCMLLFLITKASFLLIFYFYKYRRIISNYLIPNSGIKKFMLAQILKFLKTQGIFIFLYTKLSYFKWKFLLFFKFKKGK